MSIKKSIQIMVDCDNLISQARQLERAADTCGEGSTKLLNQLSEMRDHWQGEAADAMFLKLTELYRGNIAIQKELREKAAKLRQIAESLRWADETTAAEIYGGSGRF